MVAKNMAITALDLLLNPEADLQIESSGDIYTIYRGDYYTWLVFSQTELDTDENYQPLEINKSALINFISRLRKITSVSICTKLDRLMPDVVIYLYRCYKNMGHIGCEEEIEPSMETIQKKYRQQRDVNRRMQRSKIGQELKVLPPMGSFQGGEEYLETYERNKQYFK